MTNNKESNDIIFSVDGDKEMLRLASNGDIFVKGVFANHDQEIVNVLREFILNIKERKPNE